MLTEISIDISVIRDSLIIFEHLYAGNEILHDMSILTYLQDFAEFKASTMNRPKVKEVS